MILGKITHAEGMWGIICTIFSILLQSKTAFKKKVLKTQTSIHLCLKPEVIKEVD